MPESNDEERRLLNLLATEDEVSSPKLTEADIHAKRLFDALLFLLFQRRNSESLLPDSYTIEENENGNPKLINRFGYLGISQTCALTLKNTGGEPHFLQSQLLEECKDGTGIDPEQKKWTDLDRLMAVQAALSEVLNGKDVAMILNDVSQQALAAIHAGIRRSIFPTEMPATELQVSCSSPQIEEALFQFFTGTERIQEILAACNICQVYWLNRGNLITTVTTVNTPPATIRIPSAQKVTKWEEALGRNPGEKGNH